MRYVVCTAIALMCTNLRAQTPPASPRFEVASVKPAASDEKGIGGIPMMREMMRNNRPPGMIPAADPGRIRLENWALLDLIAAAYSVRATEVSGPAWLSDQGFDIEAKVPEGTPKDQLNVMLQALLEERFGLKVHRDTQTSQGFVLAVGKNGPKLKPAEPPPTPAQELTGEEQRAKTREQAQTQLAAMMKRIQENRERGTPLGGLNTASWPSSWPSITTGELASRLVRFAEAPVVDETGLTGKYSVTIETWKNADVPGGTVFDAVAKLGLKLEPRKLTIETVVVDRVSKTPTAN
ncbi:conserved exported hypothetical protein [Candidatus Sulfopaludibacter sp. SbA3]|nr:conserved exported hypothetical protein [Candidatus Sulfopaludibacter sp. SbA3]